MIVVFICLCKHFYGDNEITNIIFKYSTVYIEHTSRRNDLMNIVVIDLNSSK